ncbi:Rieske 2Fe-2S domain-containing protein [Streptosporangium sp. NPDC051022]|uniref:Rieske (2Fe-2S) protein n=1 Tax=Streptosporangium sp. NPDC051022 TaxID=3155752 RepID=UPI003447E1A3
MPPVTRRVMIFRSLAGGVTALVTSAVAWARPAEATESDTDATTVLAKTKSIPVGGGKIIRGTWVVTQPTRGTFRAFSAKCTHQGCTVASVSGGTINCPCHGSRFRVSDGSVVRGPAARALPGQRIKVSKGVIRLA